MGFTQLGYATRVVSMEIPIKMGRPRSLSDVANPHGSPIFSFHQRYVR